MRASIFFLAVLCTIPVAAAETFVSIGAPKVVDPGLPFFVSLQGLDLHDQGNVYVTLDVPPGFVIVKPNPSCSTTATSLSCGIGGSGLFLVTVVAPDIREGASYDLRASISFGDSVTAHIVLPQTFVVENANDAGPGSLRAAINDANTGCTFSPCKVSFRITGLDNHISPLSPLPPIAANYTVDGTTQSRSLQPRSAVAGNIILDGSKMASGDGITMSGCFGEVQGLWIEGFHGAGIHVLHAECDDVALAISDNTIGAETSDEQPNDRGIVIDQVIGHHPQQTPIRVNHNLISGNRRSGIFLVARPVDPEFFDQTSVPVISNNIIGLDRELFQQRGNGASGIYVDGSATISGNFIAFNHQFGIGIADPSSAVVVAANSIFANWQRGIDIGLDDAVPSIAPSILSARYDTATNRTLIDLVVPNEGDGNLPPDVYLYTSDAPHHSGFGDGQFFIGFLSALTPGQRVTFATTGDWRGKWVSATQSSRLAAESLNVPIQRTSEFGKAVKVE
jgi:hypothetical protein